MINRIFTVTLHLIHFLQGKTELAKQVAWYIHKDNKKVGDQKQIYSSTPSPHWGHYFKAILDLLLYLVYTDLKVSI